MARFGRWISAGVVAAVAVTGGAAVASVRPALPKPDHVVVVILENKPYDAVIGHPLTPWISSLAEHSANLTHFYAETHPSQPNYLALFSGSTQGVSDNDCPHDLGARPNLASRLIGAGRSFVGYSEDLPSPGWRGCTHRGYVRRHNPWVNFSNVPAAANQPLTAFPADFRKLPTVSFVVPNLCHDMHDCPKAGADSWLRKRFAPYVSWAATHNSLFIVTFDEDDRSEDNHIATIVAGAQVKPGRYPARFDHYHLLRTLQEMYGLAPTGAAAQRPAIRGIFTEFSAPRS